MSICIKKEGRKGRHCFCYSPIIQHAIPNHTDKACCWCGKIECFTRTKTEVQGHGPFRRHT